MNKFNPKFLLCVDKQKNNIYILHRLYPACLIQVVQETPMRFVIQDLYDEIDNPKEILLMPFFQDAKDFFKKIVEKGFNSN